MCLLPCLKNKLCSANGKEPLRAYGGGNYSGIEMVLLICVRVENGCPFGQFNSNLLNVAGESHGMGCCLPHCSEQVMDIYMDKKSSNCSQRRISPRFFSVHSRSACLLAKPVDLLVGGELIVFYVLLCSV